MEGGARWRPDGNPIHLDRVWEVESEGPADSQLGVYRRRDQHLPNQ